MLPRIARMNPGLSSRSRSSLLMCGLALFALPTWFASAQPQDVAVAKKTSSSAIQRPSPATVVKSAFAAPVVEFLPPLSDAEQAIVRELDLPTSFDFTNESLAGMRATLMERHKFNIIFDYPSLEAEAQDPESIDSTTSTYLTLRVSNVPLRSALKLLFLKNGLVFFVEDDVLKITSETGWAPGWPLTRTYPVRDLVGDEEVNYQVLIEAIQAGVEPHTWKSIRRPEATGEVGKLTDAAKPGAAPVSGKDTSPPVMSPFGSSESDRWATISMVPASASLVIRQTWHGHEDVLKLLRALRKAKAESPEK